MSNIGDTDTLLPNANTFSAVAGRLTVVWLVLWLADRKSLHWALPSDTAAGRKPYS